MSPQDNPYAAGIPIAGMEKIGGEIASASRRFWTFVIDVIAIRVSFFIGEVFYVIAFGPEAYDAASNSAMWFLASVLFYAGYYLALESFFGRTLGKWLLGTIVVTESGASPSLSSILVRTLARLIPLEPMSFSLGETWWHDSLSKTKVLYIRPTRPN